MKKTVKVLIAIAVIIITTSIAYGQFANTQEAIKYRKAVMYLIGQNFKSIDAMVQNKVSYDKEVFAKHAAVLEMLSTMPWEAMTTPGTQKGDTTLSSTVFNKGDKFKAAINDFETAATELSKLAAAGNIAGAKTQFGVVATSCKGCHSQFRTR